jgi:RND family efflux transporter MFP subunit
MRRSFDRLPCLASPPTRIPAVACAVLIPFALSAPAAKAADAITLSAEQVKSLQIVTAPVVASSVLPLARLPAEVVAPLESSRTVSTPFAGVVASVVVDEGAMVAAGAPLARVQSRDFLTAQADLARSRSETTLAQSQSRRDAALFAEGIIARSRADETQARTADAQARFVQARDALAAVSIPAKAAAGEYELRAPTAGRVLRRSISPGQVVGAFEPAFTITTGNGVDVLVQAPIEHRAGYVPGRAVVMDDGTRGELVAIAAATDAGSQSVRLRAHLVDAQTWLVGQRTSVRLELQAPSNAVRVPASAIVPNGAAALVFVADGSRYRAVPVERLGNDDQDAIVSGALESRRRRGLQRGKHAEIDARRVRIAC